jgi:hypothetical protein
MPGQDTQIWLLGMRRKRGEGDHVQVLILNCGEQSIISGSRLKIDCQIGRKWVLGFSQPQQVTPVHVTVIAPPPPSPREVSLLLYERAFGVGAKSRSSCRIFYNVYCVRLNPSIHDPVVSSFEKGRI